MQGTLVHRCFPNIWWTTQSIIAATTILNEVAFSRSPAVPPSRYQSAVMALPRHSRT